MSLRYMENSVSEDKVTRQTRATLGEPTFYTFPYKRRQTVHTRKKQLAQLKG